MRDRRCQGHFVFKEVKFNARRSSCGRNINTSDKASTSKLAGQQAEPNSEILHSTDSTDLNKSNVPFNKFQMMKVISNEGKN